MHVSDQYLSIGVFMRTAEIYVFDKFAGNLVEDDYGTFTFQYDAA